MQAYEVSALAAQEKEQRKKEERVTKLWTKLIQGLRIRERISAQYATPGASTTVVVPNGEVSLGNIMYETVCSLFGQSDEEGGFDVDGAEETTAVRGTAVRSLADTSRRGGPPQTFKPVEDSDSVRVTQNPLVAPVRAGSDDDDDDLEEIIPSMVGFDDSVPSGLSTPVLHSNGNGTMSGNGNGSAKRIPKSLSEFAAARRVLEAQERVASSTLSDSSAFSDAVPSPDPSPAPSARPMRPARTRTSTATATPKRASRKRPRRQSSASSASEPGEDYAPSKAQATPRPAARSKAVASAPASDRVLRTRSSTRKSMREE